MAKPADLGGRERAGIARNPAVEARRRRHQRALVGGECLGDGARRDPWLRARKRLGERAHVAVVAREAVDRVLERGAHLVGVLDGEADLVFQARRAAVPEQQRAPGHVPQARRMARQAAAGHALALGLAVGEGELGIVAGGAGDGAGGGQLGVLEDALAERDLRRRRRIAGRVGHERRPREARLQRGQRIDRLRTCALFRRPQRHRRHCDHAKRCSKRKDTPMA